MTTHDVREAQLPGIGCRIVRPPLRLRGAVFSG